MKIDPRLTIKSLLYVAPQAGPGAGRSCAATTRLHERKLARRWWARSSGPPIPRRCASISGRPAGSVGPLGVRVPILADETLREGAYVVGANREGFHLRGVAPGRDFEARFADLHTVAAGEACPQCGEPLASRR